MEDASVFEGTSLFTVDLFSRLAINMVSIYVIVWLCYYKRFPRRDFVFSFILFGLGVFLVTKVLHQVNLPMGFAFGLLPCFPCYHRIDLHQGNDLSVSGDRHALICAIAPLLYYELIAINLGILVVAQLTDLKHTCLRGGSVSHDSL